MRLLHWRVFAILVLLGTLASSAVPAAAENPGNTPFQRTWARTDRPVVDARVSRTWMWGPQANSPLLYEDYDEGPDGRRVVQYFDKSRMEITDPDADPQTIWYVTNGLLSKELISGQLQLGDNRFEPRQPAQVNVAGDQDDASAPTYATFATLLDAPPAADGAPLTTRLSRDGTTNDDPELASHGVTAAYRLVAGDIDHQVAAPFWTFMNSSGLVFQWGQFSPAALFVNPFYATGFPISEAYWARVSVGGTPRDVLVQCFERRCLTYTPGNPAGFETEAGNVGQHYYQWRYGTEQPVTAPAPDPEPVVPDQVTWRQLQPAGSAPAARRDHALAADADGSRVYLFGGRSGAGTYGDLWAYDVAANSWSELAPTGTQPAARFGHNAVFDTLRGRFIVFGGQNVSGFFSDVWAYDVAANAWTQLAADDSGPLVRYGAGGAYDPLANVLYISHGFTANGRYDDTWGFDLDGDAWQDISAAGARPEPRCLLRTVADPARGRLLLFGGQSNSASFLGDLWSFDLTSHTWQQLSGGPSARNLYAVARPADRDVAFFFGGSTGSGFSNELWALDLATDSWTLVPPNGAAPTPRYSHDAVWLPGRDVLLVFGGSDGGDLNEVWEASF